MNRKTCIILLGIIVLSSFAAIHPFNSVDESPMTSSITTDFENSGDVEERDQEISAVSPRIAAPDQPDYDINVKNHSMVTNLIGVFPLILENVTKGDGASSIVNASVEFLTHWYSFADISDGNQTKFICFIDFKNFTGNTNLTIYVENNATASRQKILNITVSSVAPDLEFLPDFTDRRYVSTNYNISVVKTNTTQDLEYLQLDIQALFGNFSLYSPINLTQIGSTDTYYYIWPIVENEWTEGEYKLTFTARDESGSETVSTKNLIVDRTSPEFFIVSPQDQAVIGGDYLFQMNAFDLVSGIDLVQIAYLDQEITLDAPVSGVYYEYEFPTTSYSDGAINVSYTALNYAGIENEQNLTYYIDNTDPVVSIDLDSSLTGVVNLNLSVSDSSNLSRIRFQVDGGIRELPLDKDQVISVDTRLYLDGNHTLNLLVEDAADPINMANDTYLLLFDNSAPQLSSLSLNDGEALDKKQTLIFQVYDVSDCEMWISVDEGDYVQIPNAQFNYWNFEIEDYFNLTSGTHLLKVKAVDPFGYEDIDEFYVYYNITPANRTWLYIGGGSGIVLLGVGAFFVIRMIKGKKASK